MLDSKFIGGSVGTCLSAFGISYSTTQVESIVSIVCTILGLVITIATTIVIPLIRKIMKARLNGNITLDDIEEFIETTKDGIDKLGGKDNE